MPDASLVNDFIVKLKKRKIEGSKATAKLTAELLRSFISQQRLPHTNQAGALIEAVKSVGEKLIAANPVELAVGNIVRRVLHIIREEEASLTTAAIGGLSISAGSDDEDDIDHDDHPVLSAAAVVAAARSTLRAPSLQTLLEDLPHSTTVPHTTSSGGDSEGKSKSADKKSNSRALSELLIIITTESLCPMQLNPFPFVTEEKKPVQASDESHLMSSPQCRLQSLVDLVMWRDSSRSALMFGVGTFLIISSSYTQDLKFSLISVASYMSLLYLGVIFLFKSLPHREAIGMGKRSEYVIGEEEAIWVLRRILPYINELLLKIRALFSGDPATTMKMAVLLFVLAQCGSSLTIWKMAKLGFFGVFTVPKVCSSYSAQLTTYGMFWIRRFRDAWESCTHKKAVAFGIFTLVWNLSSLAARIWAAFMLYVAFRYYQESKVREEEDDEGKSVKPEEEVAAAAPKIGPRHVGRQRRPIFMDTAK